MWIDLSHGAVLTAEQGLDLVPGTRQRDLALLPLLPPAASDLDPERFTLAATTDDDLARVVIDEVHSLQPDRAHQAKQFHHVLHLTRTDLVIGEDGRSRSIGMTSAMRSSAPSPTTISSSTTSWGPSVSA